MDYLHMLWPQGLGILWSSIMQKRKASKTQTDELLRLGWYPSGWWDWCMPDNKKDTKICEEMSTIFMEPNKYEIVVLVI